MPNILIIEDQLLLCETLRLALEGPGYVIRCAENAEQGMLYILNWDMDVVVVDYMLPGMNGVDLIEHIVGNRHACSLQEKQKPKIILLSAMLDEELKGEAMAAGADGCLAKPFNLIALRMMVEGEDDPA